METVAPFPETIAEVREAGGEVYRYCYQCGKCDVVCPWNRVRDFSIRRIIREATFGLTQIESEDIWRCTTCGTCPQECPRGVEQVELGVALRRVASKYDVFPASVRSARAVRAGLTLEGNPLNEERAKRGDWAKDLPVRPFEEGMDVLYFVGCYYSYDPRLRKVAAATARILARAGVRFGILGEREGCCGESVRKTGAEQLFRDLARHNIKTWIDAGVKKIVVASPHCYHTFKNEYPEFKVNFEIVHMSQFLLGLVRDGRLKLEKPYPKRVAYHDPCYLGRHNGIFDEPRELLRAVPGLELVELADARQKSLCCGGGGGRVWMDTPRGERFSDLRLDQARDVGAEVLATACPYCITMFEDSRLTREDENLATVRDLAEIVEQAL
ncbi:MAG: (Fe-S)-binding protein [Deltaproteobacteria bacterium]|nr:(Fe-S)-binding protein [Deltaproteobacteria bacterium]